MSSIAPVQPQTPAPVQAPRSTGVDADGDHDGSKAAGAPAPVQAPVSKPTATLGNNVNVFA